MFFASSTHLVIVTAGTDTTSISYSNFSMDSAPDKIAHRFNLDISDVEVGEIRCSANDQVEAVFST